MTEAPTRDSLAPVLSDAARQPRHPWLALLLSLICPGLGQIYATHVRRGVRLLALALVINALALAVLTVPPESFGLLIGGAGLVAAGLAYQIGVAIDAYRLTRRTGLVALTRVNRLWVYVVILLGWWGMQAVAPDVRWRSYSTPAASMLPNIVVGDYYLTWRNYFAEHPPQPGELVVFKLPRDNQTDYVKRIVGLPGHTVQLRDGRLYINGAVVPRDNPIAFTRTEPDGSVVRATQYTETLPNGARHTIIEMSDTGPLDNTPVFTVPPGHVFVLGDNRDNSLDSRVLSTVGFVPLGNLRDRPTIIFWSSDLSRLGQPLR